MSAVEQAASLIWETSRADEGTISATGANLVAIALSDADLLRDEPDLMENLKASLGVLTCGWCGKRAAGFATVGSVRYCHGEDDDPTCYQKRHWAGSTMAPFARAEPVTVTTVEELDALPSGSVVLTADHVALQKDRHGRWGEGLSMPSTLVAELAWKPATVLYQPHRNLT